MPAKIEKEIKNEQMLYGVFLDLWYAQSNQKLVVEEAKEELVHASAQQKKINKLLNNVKSRYTQLYGKEPRSPK